MTRLELLRQRDRAARAEQTIGRCSRCGAWTIAHRPCTTPFCHTTTAQQQQAS